MDRIHYCVVIILAYQLYLINSFLIPSNCIFIVETHFQDFDNVQEIFTEIEVSFPISKIPTIIIVHSTFAQPTEIKGSDDDDLLKWNHYNNLFNASANSASSKFIQTKWTWSTDCLYIFSLSAQPEFLLKSLKYYGGLLAPSARIFLVSSPDQNPGLNLSGLDRQHLGPIQASVVFVRICPNHVQLWSVLCLLCADPFEPKSIIINNSANSINPNLHNQINSISTLLNTNGHGSTALLCRLGSSRSRFQDTTYHAHLETSAWYKYDPDISTNGVILGVLMNILNFTIQYEEWNATIAHAEYFGIYLAPSGDVPSEYKYGSSLIVTEVIEEYFLYCRSVPRIPDTGWDFFTHPFDIYIWVCILATTVSFALLHRCTWSYGADVLWSVLGLPFSNQAKWASSKTLFSLLLTMIVLNCAYLSVITSRVIKPNIEPDLANVSELWKEGFRFIDPNGSDPGYGLYYGSWFRAGGVLNYENDTVIEVHDCIYTHSPACISKWADVATGLLYKKDKEETLLSINPIEVREKCHAVQDSFRSYWLTFYQQGPLAYVIYKIQLDLIAAGIDIVWEDLKKRLSLLTAWRKSSWRPKDYVRKLSFDTPILVVFKGYAALVAVCLIVFWIELVVVGWNTIWERMCMKNKQTCRNGARTYQNDGYIYYP